ncbi:MAG: hypothetical protein KAI45_02110 [Melioribacteraceae bacterium]|nr:hypothetical protein [Melioribacteraceae bacterium]
MTKFPENQALGKDMKKWIANTILWIIGIFALLFITLPYLMSWQFSSSHKDTWDIMDNSDFKCPPNTEITTRGWSKVGYMRYCEPKKNGPWEAWSEGYKNIQGEYYNGKKHGKWTWFNSDGSTQSTITYEYGKEKK